MNFSSTDYTNFSRLEPVSSHRQSRLLGPLLGFFLATLFPNLAIARLQHGSIKFQYDPIPQYVNHPPSITIFQNPLPTWEPATKPPEEFLNNESHVMYSDTDVSTNIENPDYMIPAQSQKVTVKRSAPSRYLNYNRRINKYSTTRRRFPEYDYVYDYLANPRLRNRIRNQGRRPIGFDDDYAYDYDYETKNSNKRKQQQRRRNKNRNKKDPDYYSSDEDLSNEVERVTNNIRPRQQQTTTDATTTTTESTTMPSTTLITNGTTPGTTTSTNQTTGYGYGPSSGNENISITYGPPSALQPVYGPPSSIYGSPVGDWSPSYPYDSPSSYYAPTSYQSPSISYGSPSISSSSHFSPSVPYPAPPPSNSYGSPIYSKPYASPSSSYTPPSSSYGVHGQSYGVPSQTYGVPSQSPSPPTGSGPGRATYQSYQLPFSSWYGRSASQSDIARKAQDIIRLD